MKLTHSFDREDVMAYADHALSPQDAARVERHLDGCDECRALVAELRALSARLAAWQVEASPVRLTSLIGRAPVAAEPATPVPRHAGWFGRRAFGVPRWALVGVPATALLAAIFVLPQRRATNPSALAYGVVAGTGGQAQEAADPQQRKLASAPSSSPKNLQASDIEAARTGPMIVRTASMRLSTEAFDAARAQIEGLVTTHAGRIGSIEVFGDSASGRSLHATLRFPSAGLAAALAAIRQVGKVTSEKQTSEEITDAYRNLTVRIANGRREEQRLVELLAKRTGDLSDVLAVEQALARVRGEVEQMEASERTMKGRVDEATITLQLVEAHRADLGLGPVSLGTRFHNALVVGVRDAADGLLALVLWLIEVGPTLLLWLIILAWPARKIWRGLTMAMRQ